MANSCKERRGPIGFRGHIEILRRTGGDIELWLAAHIGHLYDDVKELRKEKAKLKARLTRLESQQSFRGKGEP